MLRVGPTLLLGVGLFAAGQIEQATELFPFAGLLTSGSAVGVLAWAVWYAYRHIIPRQQEAFAKTLDDMAERHERMQQHTLDRHERWETARHEDSEKIAKSLQTMAVTCAETRHVVTSNPVLPVEPRDP